MTRIIWDPVGERLFETGARNTVLFPQDNKGIYGTGVPWNGLTAVKEAPTGAESTSLYANDRVYVNLRSNEQFKATIEAYTYPDEFQLCDGSAEMAPGVMIGQQKRRPFGLSYRTAIGNDVDGLEHGYKLHLVYGATVSPSSKEYNTINDNPDAYVFSWELDTVPVEVDGFAASATLTIDSTKVDPKALKALETILYGKDPTSPNGSDGVEPRLPMPDEVAKIFAKEESKPDPAA